MKIIIHSHEVQFNKYHIQLRILKYNNNSKHLNGLDQFKEYLAYNFYELRIRMYYIFLKFETQDPCVLFEDKIKNIT